MRRRRDRKRRNERIAAALVALILVVAAIGGAISIFRSAERVTPAEPTITTVRIADPEGDARPGRRYFDIVSAAVSKEGGWFTFGFTLSAAIPASFAVPRGWDALGWEFCLDTHPSVASAGGYPFGPTTSVPCDFILMAVSKGGAVRGTLIDRRPMLDGKDAVTSSVPVTISGTEVLTSVPASSLGDPASFDWNLYSTKLMLPLGTDVYQNMDDAAAYWPAG